MATNTLDKDVRVRNGKTIEARIIKALDKIMPVVGGLCLSDWQESAPSEDMKWKIDAWIQTEEGRKSAQIKYRETGSDVGVAVLMPWEGDEAFLSDYKAQELKFDRDMVHSIDYYVVLIGGELLISPGYLPSRASLKMLDMLYEDGGFNGGRSFSTDSCPGAELRLVTDKGQGYSYGQQKVICYISPHLMARAGAVFFNLREALV